jgi:hypothetical protein
VEEKLKMQPELNMMEKMNRKPKLEEIQQTLQQLRVDVNNIPKKLAVESFPQQQSHHEIISHNQKVTKSDDDDDMSDTQKMLAELKTFKMPRRRKIIGKVFPYNKETSMLKAEFMRKKLIFQSIFNEIE